MNTEELRQNHSSWFFTIPSDWSVVKLSYFLELLTDYEANGSFADVRENVKVFNSRNYAWYVRATDLENGTEEEKVKYVDESTYKFLRKTKLYGDELLITKRGEIGKCYYFENRGHRATLGPNLYLLKLNDKVNSKFLFYFFKSHIGFKSLNRINSSTTLGALYKDDVKKINVPYPPLPEQRKIAEILSTWDDAIDQLNRLIEKKKELKKGLMQQLLTGKKRFPEFEPPGGTKYKKTKLGEVPEDWEVLKVKDTCGILFSNVDKKSNPNEAQVKLCNYTDVYYGGIITKGKTNDYMTATATENEIKRFTLRKGDVIITKDSETADDIAVPAYIAEEIQNLVCGYHLAILRPFSHKALGLFIYYLIQHPKINHWFERRANGVTRYGLSTESISGAEVILPSIPEQEKISLFLRQIDTEISLLKENTIHLKTQKKGLMQQLLTGKRRVKTEKI